MAATFKWLERCIVNKLGLFYDMEVILDAIITRPGSFTPVEEMIVVYHTTTKVGLLRRIYKDRP